MEEEKEGAEMRCREASELMSLHLDHAVAQGRVMDLQDHLAGCPRCQEVWMAMQRVSSLLTVAPLVTPPADFTARVMDRLAQREARRRLFWGGLVLLLGALSLGAMTLPSLIGALSYLWLLIAHPSLASKGLLVTAQLVSTLRSFGEVCWLVGRALLSAVDPSLLLFYALAVLLLTGLWIRLMRLSVALNNRSFSG